MHRTLCLVMLALLAAMAAAPAGAPGTALTFGAPVTLPHSSGHGEPGIEVAHDGTLYVVAPYARTSVWRSLDGGATFQRLRDSLGDSGDSDVETDADGRLYVSDLFRGVPVSLSADKGATYLAAVSTATGSGLDRQWLAAHGHGNAWSAWRQDGAGMVARTTDGGLTWSEPVVAATGVALQGNVLATSDATLWIPYSTGKDLMLAKSADGGATWARTTVAAGAGDTLLFPALAVDDAGHVYVAWSQGAGQVDRHTEVKLARSLDGGATFGPPTTLSQPSRHHLFPWIVANGTGHVALAWYEGVPPVGATIDPNVAPLTEWHVHVAHSLDAHAASPTWEHARATGVFHTGPICTYGALCFPADNPLAFNRLLLDFFEMALLPDGRLVIAYAADTSATATGSVLKVVRQTGGNVL